MYIKPEVKFSWIGFVCFKSLVMIIAYAQKINSMNKIAAINTLKPSVD